MWGYFKPYVSVGKKKEKALKTLEKLRKKNRNIQPVILEGNSLARTWWAKAWNRNLESYADYSNRIGRGRSYVRHHAVLDLQIKEGLVTALVQGSLSAPYKVEIKMKALNKATWKSIKDVCKGELNSLSELLAGKFPKGLGELFTQKGSGLFPSPAEISFNCSCPDWADMCKHVAASLYGVGARLDEDPGLFFVLRKVDVLDLISGAVKSEQENLLKKSRNAAANIIQDSDLSALFGIDMEAVEIFEKKVKGLKKTSGTRSVKKKTPKKARKTEIRRFLPPSQGNLPSFTKVHFVII